MRKTVHVVPLGWEFDRVVLPVLAIRAHRVYLLCRPSSDPKRTHYLDAVTKRLKRAGIQVVHRDVDSNLDIEGLVREISAIIQLEQGGGKSVRLNVSGAGKVAAAAVQLAASAHLDPRTGSLYYPVAERYSSSETERREHGLAVGMDGDPVELPFFHLEIPSEDARFVMQLLASSPNGDLRYTMAIQALSEAGFEQYSASIGSKGTLPTARNRGNVALSKRVVERLKSLNYVEVRRRGRERIMHLTGSGRYMAMLCTGPLGVGEANPTYSHKSRAPG